MHCDWTCHRVGQIVSARNPVEQWVMGLLDGSVFALHLCLQASAQLAPSQESIQHIITTSSLLESWFGCFPDNEGLWGRPCLPHNVRLMGLTQLATCLFPRSLLTLGAKPQLFLAQPNGKFNSQLISPEFGAHHQVTGLPLSQEKGTPHPQMANI